MTKAVFRQESSIFLTVSLFEILVFLPHSEGFEGKTCFFIQFYWMRLRKSRFETTKSFEKFAQKNSFPPQISPDGGVE
jgi:hypothetical protein